MLAIGAVIGAGIFGSIDPCRCRRDGRGGACDSEAVRGRP